MLDRRAAHAERATDGLGKKFGQDAVIRGIAYDEPEKPGLSRGAPVIARSDTTTSSA